MIGGSALQRQHVEPAAAVIEAIEFGRNYQEGFTENPRMIHDPSFQVPALLYIDIVERHGLNANRLSGVWINEVDGIGHKPPLK